MVKNLFRLRGLSFIVGLSAVGIVTWFWAHRADNGGSGFGAQSFALRYLITVVALYGGIVLTNLIPILREKWQRRRLGG